MAEATENGALIPNIKFADGRYFYDAIVGKFNVIYFTDEAAVPQALVAEVAQLKAAGLPVQLVALSLVHESVVGADQSFVIGQDTLQQRFYSQVGGIYLVRPDEHIHGRWLQYQPNTIFNTYAQFSHVKQGVVA